VIRALFTRPAPGCFDQPSSGSVRFTFLGTAGFVVHHATRTFVLDPYLSRAGLWRTAYGRLPVDHEAVRRFVPHADEVLVGHSHYDHALDAPAVATHTGARLLGSADTRHIAAAAGFDLQRYVTVSPREAVACGACTATAWPSRHGKALLGRVPLPGRLTAPPPWPPRIFDLPHGDVFHWHLDVGGLRVLHVDSADYFDDQLAPADVLLLCAVGRQYRQDYTRTIVERVRPRVVIPCHWDDFTVPLGTPPRQLPGVDVEGFVDEIRTAGAEAVVLAPLQSWSA
jgi:L-ascorbate metabolism protein UlaG (beta-lactamase superfamily)